MTPGLTTGAKRCAVCLAALAYACGGGESGEQRMYVETLGTDTTALEAFTSDASGFEGVQVTRTPLTRVARYRGDRDADGRLRRLEVEWFTPPANPDAPGPGRIVTEIDGDSAIMVREAPVGTDTVKVPAPAGVIPGIFPVPIALWEEAAREAMASGEAPHELAFLVQNGGLFPSRIERQGADTLTADFFGNPLLIALDAEGNVEGVSGRRTTFQIEARRLPVGERLDLMDLAGDFAARDARGEGIGPPSPTDTVRATVSGATLEIVYSRPAKRGREIWGGLVPWNEVWRTGANAATHFTTDRDLEIGDARLPAGSYTLWSSFSPDSAYLIVNEQTGIWGTQHDPEHDLLRIPLVADELEDPVERFTMELAPSPEGAVLQLSWDRVRYSVPLRVR